MYDFVRRVGFFYLCIYTDRVEVRPEGFEPPTVGLKGHCSTTEL